MASDVRLPDFLCIGGMRCGSTQLWGLLRQHSDIFMPDLKEVHFFDNRAGGWDRGLDFYASFFKDAPPQALVGESTPIYLALPEVPQRIYDTIPRARLIAGLRDPAARAWSHYWHFIRTAEESRPVEDVFEEEIARFGEPPRTSEEAVSYLARGRYLEQLQRYAALFPREQLHIFFFEQLIDDREATLRAVHEFLGVDPQAPVDEERAAEHQYGGIHPRSRTAHIVGKRLKRWLRSRRLLPGGAEAALKGAYRQMNVRKGTPKMPAELRTRILMLFEEHDQALAAWLDRPLPWRR